MNHNVKVPQDLNQALVLAERIADPLRTTLLKNKPTLKQRPLKGSSTLITSTILKQAKRTSAQKKV